MSHISFHFLMEYNDIVDSMIIQAKSTEKQHIEQRKLLKQMKKERSDLQKLNDVLNREYETGFIGIKERLEKEEEEDPEALLKLITYHTLKSMGKNEEILKRYELSIKQIEEELKLPEVS